MSRLALVACLLIGPTAATAAAQGPYQRQKIDVDGASRGRALYARHCINCHGSTAKGTDRGPDLIRSTAVLHDRLGAGIAPAIARSPTHQATLTAAEIADLSHFLHQRIESIAFNRAPRGPIDVLTGDPEAGRAYFNGAGGCRACHSTTGDLAGVATRIADPVNLQQRMLFPTLRRDGPRQITVSVTSAGTAVAGTLLHLDDFSVSLRDKSGAYHAFERGPAVKVIVTDPLATHHALLDRYTDADMHNLTAYLARLK